MQTMKKDKKWDIKIRRKKVPMKRKNRSMNEV